MRGWGGFGENEEALGCIVRGLKGVENLVGILVVNEAKWGAEGMWEWYESVEGIKAMEQEIPVYIPDGWDLRKASTNGLC